MWRGTTGGVGQALGKKEVERQRRAAARRVLEYKEELLNPRLKVLRKNSVRYKESEYACKHRKVVGMEWPRCWCHWCRFTCPTQRAAVAAAHAVLFILEHPSRAATAAAAAAAALPGIEATRAWLRKWRKERRPRPAQPQIEEQPAAGHVVAVKRVSAAKKQPAARPAGSSAKRAALSAAVTAVIARRFRHLRRNVAPDAEAPPVAVAVRVRDLLYRELGSRLAVSVEGAYVGVKVEQHITALKVDSALWSVRTPSGGPSASSTTYSGQAEVFAQVGRPLVAAILSGKNAAFIACGPSGSGKTHSTFGPPGDPGVVPRVLEEVCASGSVRHLEIEAVCVYQSKVHCLLREQDAGAKRKHKRFKSAVNAPVLADTAVWKREGYEAFLAECRRLEKVNECARARRRAGRRAARLRKRDKASAGAVIRMRTPGLPLRTDASGWAAVVGAQRRRVHCAADALRLIAAAAKRRPTAWTPLNDTSSRGHVVLRVAVHLRDGRTPQLCVADLAGGERLHSLGAPRPRLLESNKINTALLALRRAIACYGRGQLVCRRENPLTRVLPLANTELQWLTTMAPGAADAAAALLALQEAEAVRGMQRMRDESRAAAERMAEALAQLEKEMAERRALVIEHTAAGLTHIAAALASVLAAARIAEWRAEVAEYHTPLVLAVAAAAAGISASDAYAARRQQLLEQVSAAKRRYSGSFKGAIQHYALEGMRNCYDPAVHPVAVLQTVWDVLQKKKAKEDRKEALLSGSDSDAAKAQSAARSPKRRKQCQKSGRRRDRR
eukprot:TRINITY_DN19483_c0_g1_i2.p1 TRINITY_DN19483_c0_g1~~TRINITY_DN19483_c0_g1_i2.p1  ORF type:complete len:783 (+),score=270.47 TRINITY_DN19483_c0_g1_i2:130-2478(+)